ncbi:hypothetical protein NN561_010452 [Cricetulus griseus]
MESPARESRLSRRRNPGREDTASRLPCALPGPRASRQSRGPPPRGSGSGAAATARRGCQRHRSSLRAGMQAGRRALGARVPGSPFPLLRLPAALPPLRGQGPLRARRIVGDVVRACVEGARALRPGAPADAVAWQPRGAAAAALLEKTQRPDCELKSPRPTTDLPPENQPSRCSGLTLDILLLQTRD